jgi:Protein of unknown function (DUF2568)
LLAAVVWGAWVAPEARWPVPIPTRVVIELVLFGGAVGALVVAGQPVLAVVLGVCGARHLAAQRLPGTPGERQTARSVGWWSASPG